MTTLRDRIARLRESDDPCGAGELVPYMRFLGLSIDRSTGELLGKLSFADKVIGNPAVPAIHGGAISALLENTAVFEVLLSTRIDVLPKTINVTIDYLRPARPRDTWARATIRREGRRVCTVYAEAWQEDRKRTVATARIQFLVGGPRTADPG